MTGGGCVGGGLHRLSRGELILQILYVGFLDGVLVILLCGDCLLPQRRLGLIHDLLMTTLILLFGYGFGQQQVLMKPKRS